MVNGELMANAVNIAYLTANNGYGLWWSMNGEVMMDIGNSWLRFVNGK